MPHNRHSSSGENVHVLSKSMKTKEGPHVNPLRNLEDFSENHYPPHFELA